MLRRRKGRRRRLVVGAGAGTDIFIARGQNGPAEVVLAVLVAVVSGHRGADEDFVRLLLLLLLLRFSPGFRVRLPRPRLWFLRTPTPTPTERHRKHGPERVVVHGPSMKR